MGKNIVHMTMHDLYIEYSIELLNSHLLRITTGRVLPIHIHSMEQNIALMTVQY